MVDTAFRIMVVGDAVAVLLGFVAPLLLLANRPLITWTTPLAAVLLTAVLMGCTRRAGLWRRRINSVAVLELSHLTRAVLMATIMVFFVDRILNLYVHAEAAAIAAAVGWVALVGWRGMFRSFLGHQRAQGRFLQRALVVGTDRRAAELCRAFETHPEGGVRVDGVIGSWTEADQSGMGHLWRASYLDVGEALEQSDAEIVVLCTSDLNPAFVSHLMRDETSRHQVFLDSGLSGIASSRLQATSLAHEPLIQVGSPHLSATQMRVKRVVDAAVAAVVLLAAAPVLAVVAALIKLTDRGPVFFKQLRIGQGGAPFTMYKFRSMVVDAEAQLDDLTEGNERNGPLFKLDGQPGGDPRVTRIGRFIRATSIDELPQLWNVLKGQMSLVGPRPALPEEVAKFPAELRRRHAVRPGVSGLWQVEARDNPAFAAYQRLDLFYVENWSISLDVAIVLQTIGQTVVRPLLRLNSP